MACLLRDDAARRQPRATFCRCSIEWVRFDRERYNPRALAAVRQGAREGTLLDVATDQIFIALLLRNLTPIAHGRGGGAGPAPRIPSDQPLLRPPDPAARADPRGARPSSPTAPALVDEDYVVKIYRKLEVRH